MKQDADPVVRVREVVNEALAMMGWDEQYDYVLQPSLLTVWQFQEPLFALTYDWSDEAFVVSSISDGGYLAKKSHPFVTNAMLDLVTRIVEDRIWKIIFQDVLLDEHSHE